MFAFTKQDLANFYQFVVINIVQKLKIKDAEWKSIGELKTEMSESNSDIYDLLVKFFKDYQSWYDYSYDECGMGKYNDSDSRYIELSNIRDTTRNALLQKLNT